MDELSGMDRARIEEVADALARISSYSPDEATAIILAIVRCRPKEEIAVLLVCSPDA